MSAPDADNAADIALLEAWRSGESSAGLRLYERQADRVIRFFRNKLNRDADIEELVQETFLRVLEGAERVHNPGAIRAFVLGTAKYVLFEHFRALHRAHILDPDVDTVAQLQPGPSTIAAHKREHRLLLEALRQLPLRQQVILELFYLERMKSKELALLMGLTHSTMRGQLRTARIALQQKISELGDSAPLIASTLDNLDAWAAGVRREVEKIDPNI